MQIYSLNCAGSGFRDGIIASSSSLFLAAVAVVCSCSELDA